MIVFEQLDNFLTHWPAQIYIGDVRKHHTFYIHTGVIIVPICICSLYPYNLDLIFRHMDMFLSAHLSEIKKDTQNECSWYIYMKNAGHLLYVILWSYDKKNIQ